MTTPPEVRIIGITGLPEVTPGSDLVELVLQGCRRLQLQFMDGDILVFTHKVVSKAEGRLVPLSRVTPSPLAVSFAREGGRDPRSVEVVLSQARRVVKMDRGILIAETQHGLVCAQAGVDASNVPDPDTVALLPEDPDRSAAALRRAIYEKTGARTAVIISDTFGRPWREGLTNVAIGVDGMLPLVDYRGQSDPHGRSLSATVIAAADELAGAAELVMGKLDRVPVALIQGYAYRRGRGSASQLVRPADRDLFR
ncbi:MAG: coenzyme F420-0:L-glutamate ligase [Acidobacteriota bacterium]